MCSLAVSTPNVLLLCVVAILSRIGLFCLTSVPGANAGGGVKVLEKEKRVLLYLSSRERLIRTLCQEQRALPEKGK